MRHSIPIVVLIAIVFAGTSPASAVDGEQRLGNTLPGAPFHPSAERSGTVLERTTLIRSISDVRTALAQRDSGLPASTIAILQAETSSLENRLTALPVEALIEETTEFGIGLAAFPVAELRKPLTDGWHEPRPGGRRHMGNDILAHYGVALRALEDATVEQVKESRVGGRTVYLIGDSGSRYYYAHMEDVLALEPGDQLLAGEAIGTVGDTGNAQGIPHLHLQWDPAGGSDWQNPYPLLSVLFGNANVEPFGSFSPRFDAG